MASVLSKELSLKKPHKVLPKEQSLHGARTEHTRFGSVSAPCTGHATHHERSFVTNILRGAHASWPVAAFEADSIMKYDLLTKDLPITYAL